MPKEAKVFKSPKSLVRSPRFHEPISNLIFSKSPSLHTQEDGVVAKDQIYNEVVDIIVAEETNQWITGLVLLFGTVFFWIFSVQILNNIMKETDYDHPLLAAYFNGSCFLLFGLKPVAKHLNSFFRDVVFGKSEPNTHDESLNSTATATYNSTDGLDGADSSSTYSFDTPKIQLTSKQIVQIAFVAFVFYFLNCFLGSAALKYTSASNQTILATTSSVFSLIIGVLFKIEKFTIPKVISVFCSICGIVLITSAATTNSLNITSLTHEELGNLLAVIGAFAYSCFLVLLRIKLGEQTNSDNDSLLYGYLGLWTIIGGVPLLLVFNHFNWEQLSLPENKVILAMLLLSSFLNSLSDYCGSCAALITSPLSVSLSLSTAIPISMFLDSYINGGVSFSFQYFVGIFLIFSSFIFTNISNEHEIVEAAIENAIEEAINHDEQLTDILSPRLQSTSSVESVGPIVDVPDLSICTALDDLSQQRLVVTGGQNHKYFFREITD